MQGPIELINDTLFTTHDPRVTRTRAGLPCGCWDGCQAMLRVQRMSPRWSAVIGRSCTCAVVLGFSLVLPVTAEGSPIVLDRPGWVSVDFAPLNLKLDAGQTYAIALSTESFFAAFNWCGDHSSYTGWSCGVNVPAFQVRRGTPARPTARACGESASPAG